MFYIYSCYVNPELLIHIDTSSQALDPGDYVVISDDLPLAEQLQSSLWHWDENMKIVWYPFLKIRLK